MAGRGVSRPGGAKQVGADLAALERVDEGAFRLARQQLFEISLRIDSGNLRRKLMAIAEYSSCGHARSSSGRIEGRLTVQPNNV